MGISAKVGVASKLLLAWAGFAVRLENVDSYSFLASFGDILQIVAEEGRGSSLDGDVHVEEEHEGMKERCAFRVD